MNTANTAVADIVKAYMLKRGYASRNKHGKSISDLVRKAGINSMSLWMFLSGKSRMRSTGLKKLCKALNIDYLMLTHLDSAVRGKVPLEEYGKAMDYFYSDLQMVTLEKIETTGPTYITRTEGRRLLSELPIIDILSEREQFILQERFGDSHKTLQQVGDELKITRERVRQIEVKAIKKLQQYHA